LLDLMSSAAPEIFDNQVEIRAIAVVADELETSDEEEATEAWRALSKHAARSCPGASMYAGASFFPVRLWVLEMRCAAD
jgi:ferredoxin